MKWQKSPYKDTNANDADTHGYHAIRRNIQMSALNARVHTGINPEKLPANNLYSREYDIRFIL